MNGHGLISKITFKEKVKNNENGILSTLGIHSFMKGKKGEGKYSILPLVKERLGKNITIFCCCYCCFKKTQEI